MSEQPAPDAGNTPDLDDLTAPLDEDDDVYCRVALEAIARGNGVDRPDAPDTDDPRP